MKKLLCVLLVLAMTLGCTTAFAETRTYKYSKIGADKLSGTTDDDTVKISDKVLMSVTWTESYLWLVPEDITLGEEPETETPFKQDVVVYGSTVPNEKYITVYVHSLNAVGEDFRLVYEESTDPDGDGTTMLKGYSELTYDPTRYASYELYTPAKTDGTLINTIATTTKTISSDGSDVQIDVRQLLQVTGQDATTKPFETDSTNSLARVPITSIVTNVEKAQDNGFYSDTLTFYAEVTMVPAT